MRFGLLLGALMLPAAAAQAQFFPWEGPYGTGNNGWCVSRPGMSCTTGRQARHAGPSPSSPLGSVIHLPGGIKGELLGWLMDQVPGGLPLGGWWAGLQIPPLGEYMSEAQRLQLIRNADGLLGFIITQRNTAINDWNRLHARAVHGRVRGRGLSAAERDAQANANQRRMLMEQAGRILRYRYEAALRDSVAGGYLRGQPQPNFPEWTY
jgi:hypothetical protein